MPPDGTTTLSEIAQAYWPVLALSFGVSVIMTPLCRKFAMTRRIVDKPDDFLKPHGRPIPYLGGVAIFLGWAAGIIIALMMFGEATEDLRGADVEPTMRSSMMWTVLVCGLIIMLIGLADDITDLPPKVKLAGNILVAGVLIWAGIGDDLVKIVTEGIVSKGPGADQKFGAMETLLFSAPIAIFIMVGACNATNLIDGVDGLCSGVLGIIAAGFLIIAVNLHTHGEWTPLDAQRVVLSLAVMGGALGFLPYNRNPATIFMGDAGSMLLGLNAAILILLFAESHGIRGMKWVLASVMVFGLPVVDMLLTLVRRWRAEQPLMVGDRSHFYDQLRDRGLSVKQVVAVSYGLAAGFAAVGVVSIFIKLRYAVLLYALTAVLCLFAIKKLQMLRVPGRRSEG